MLFQEQEIKVGPDEMNTSHQGTAVEYDLSYCLE